MVRTERFGGDFVCPDCLTDADKNIVHPLECATKANEPYKEWVEKMRQKYQYFEPTEDHVGNQPIKDWRKCEIWKTHKSTKK